MSDGEQPRSATIVAVAKLAGVSQATASRVMNDNPKVDPVLAERVRVAARELNYTTNSVARSLVLGRTNTIAILLPDLGNPTFQGILRGLSRAAAIDGYRVLIADSQEQVADEAVLARDLRQRTDGIILCAPRMPEKALSALMSDLHPVVVVNRDGPEILGPVVVADYEAGIELLADHLAQLGHTRLAYLAGNPRSMSNKKRLNGLERFARDHDGVHIDYLDCGVSFDAGFDAVDRVLDTGATGILAFNDLVAMGLMSGLRERGVDVPGDVSVVGMDDISFSRFTSPPLTTASVPVEDMGGQAWEALHRSISGQGGDFRVSFRPRLVVRASTSAPAR